MTISKVICLPAVCVLALGISEPAQASIVAEGTTVGNQLVACSATVYDTGSNTVVTLAYTSDTQAIANQAQSCSHGSDGYAAVSASASNLTGGSLSALVRNTNAYSAFAQSAIAYTISVNGPANTSILLDVSGLLSVSASVDQTVPTLLRNGGNPTARSTFEIVGPDQTGAMIVPALSEAALISIGGALTESASFNTTVSLQTNTTYGVFMSAFAKMNVAGNAAMARVDPYIGIDPNNPNAASYNLVASNGVTFTAAVPEPSGCGIFVAGIIALAGIQLSRRSPPRPAIF